MLELDEATRRALSQRYGPTPGAKARVLDELRSQLGPGGSDGGEDLPGDPAANDPSPPLGGSEQIAWVAKIVAATTGLTGAGLLVVKLGAMALTGPSDDQPTATAAAATEPAAANEQDRPIEARGRADPEPAPRSELASRTAAEPSGSSPKRRPSARAQPTRGLAAELALLEGAERLRAADPQAALARLDQHRREFPAGSLAPEREALRVELLCALGHRPQAARAREGFLASYDDPQLRARVQAGCVGTGSPRAGD